MIYAIIVFAAIAVVILYCIPHYASEADRQSEEIIKGEGE